MRYLKVTAQDRTGNGRADSVLLEFYEQDGCYGKDVLSNRAFAIDFDADGKVDYKMGDVTNNGKENTVDQRLLGSFANTYLKFNWFNRGTDRTRFLKVIAEDLQADGSPNVVRLQLIQQTQAASEGHLISWSAVFDRDNDGTLDTTFHGDANRDGQLDPVDEKLVGGLANTYLKFRWY